MYTSEVIKYAGIKAGITDLWQDSLEPDVAKKVIKILCNYLDNIDMDVARSFGYTYADLIPNDDMVFISMESVSGSPVSACQILDEPSKQTPSVYCNNNELQQILMPKLSMYSNNGSGIPSFYSISRTHKRLVIHFDKIVNMPIRVWYVPSIKKPQMTSDILEIPDSHKSYIIAGLALEIATAFQMPSDKIGELEKSFAKELALVKSMVLNDKAELIPLDCDFGRFI